jgi:hypothetical protein
MKEEEIINITTGTLHYETWSSEEVYRHLLNYTAQRDQHFVINLNANFAALPQKP